MVDFNKQKVSEQKLDDIRSTSPEEYKGDYKSPHYKEVENSNIKPTSINKKDNYNSNYKEAFDVASKDYWQRQTQNGINRYNAGKLAANFGTDTYTIEAFVDILSNLIKECIVNELHQAGKTSEDYKAQFQILKLQLEVLGKSLKDEKDIKIEDLSAYLHGFINGYIGNSVDKKIKKDKGKI